MIHSWGYTCNELMVPLFQSDELTRLIKDELDNTSIPDGHDNMYSIIATRSGIRGVTSIKIKDEWQIAAVVNVNYRGKITEGAVIIKGSWKSK